MPKAADVSAEPESSGAGEALRPGLTFVLKDVRFVGNTLLPEETLRQPALPYLEQSLDLEGVKKLAADVTKAYRQAGFPLSRAVPERQRIVDGILTLRVVEAKYQGVRVKNQSKLRSSLAERVLAGREKRDGSVDGVRAGDDVEEKVLRRRLRLLSSFPGVKAATAFQSPEKEERAEPGRTWLDLDLADDRQVRARIEIDNNGEEAIGRYRLWTRFSLNNLTGLGDSASLDLLASDKRAAWFRAAWEFGLGSEGDRLGVGVSRMDYTLAGPLYRALGAKGMSDTASLWWSRPLSLADRRALYLQARFDWKELTDTYDLFDLEIRKRAAVLSLSLSGWFTDQLGQGGATSWSLAFSPGVYRPLGGEWSQDYGDPSGGHRARGLFASFSASISRDQRLWGGGDSPWGGALRLQIRGQWSPWKNLSSSEQFSLGGISGVRGYPVGEQSGDSGALFRGEYRQSLPFGLTAFAGVDLGHVRFLTKPYAPFQDKNGRTLASLALGLGWNWKNIASLEAVAAWRLGSQAQGGRDLHPRLWLNGSLAFDAWINDSGQKNNGGGGQSPAVPAATWLSLTPSVNFVRAKGGEFDYSRVWKPKWDAAPGLGISAGLTIRPGWRAGFGYEYLGRINQRGGLADMAAFSFARKIDLHNIQVQARYDFQPAGARLGFFTYAKAGLTLAQASSRLELDGAAGAPGQIPFPVGRKTQIMLSYGLGAGTSYSFTPRLSGEMSGEFFQAASRKFYQDANRIGFIGFKLAAGLSWKF
ncbi:MAG: hypothetical protein LBV15_01725 [Planctomycetota bacterium]|nr:hypothetical protein [Planctomycetota bacterium]